MMDTSIGNGVSNSILMDKTLVELGERKILEVISEKIAKEDTTDKKSVIKGIGDDCAILEIRDNEYLVTTVDACPTPVICLLDKKVDYWYYGWFTMIISLSDLASMGADPKGMLLSIEAPNSMKLQNLLEYYDGILEASRLFNCPIIGGNIKDSTKFNCTSTALGSVKKISVLQRDKAMPGEDIVVLGDMGLFLSGVIYQLLDINIELSNEEIDLLYKNLKRPIPRLKEGKALAEHKLANCAMDCSDGLIACFYELAQSGKGIDIQLDLSNVIPESVLKKVASAIDIDIEKIMLSWGDWQLVCTTTQLQELKQVMKKFNCSVNVVGKVVKGTGNVWINKNGKNGKLNYIASERFTDSSFFSYGLESYLNKLKKNSLIV